MLLLVVQLFGEFIMAKHYHTWLFMHNQRVWPLLLTAWGSPTWFGWVSIGLWAFHGVKCCTDALLDYFCPRVDLPNPYDEIAEQQREGGMFRNYSHRDHQGHRTYGPFSNRYPGLSPEAQAYFNQKAEHPSRAHNYPEPLHYESFRQDAPYTLMCPPAWQASIWVEREGKMTIVGHANRIKGHIVTCWHVLQVAPIEMLRLVIMRPDKPTAVIPLKKFTFVNILDDIAVAPIAEAKVALPGLKEANIKHIQGFQPVAIATDFPQDNSSVAGIKNHPEAWGMVQYEGSTRGGFSGAGYFHGNALYAVHSHGGIHNVGISASYIAVKIRKSESSDYYALLHMMENSRDRRYNTRRVNPDEYEVAYQGRYFIIENREYLDLEDQYGDEIDWRRPRRSNRRNNWRDREEWEAAQLPSVEELVMGSLPETAEVEAIEPERNPEAVAPPVMPCSCAALERRMDEYMAETRTAMEKMRHKNTELMLENDFIYMVLQKVLVTPYGAQPANEEEMQDLTRRFRSLRGDFSSDPEYESNPNALSENIKCSQSRIGAGSRSESLEVIPSLLAVPNPDPSLTSSQSQPSDGLMQAAQTFAAALQPIQDILAEQRRVLSLLMPESALPSKHGLPIVTVPSTPPVTKSSRKRTKRGSKRPPVLTGPQQQVSVPSQPTAPSRTPLAGTASGSRTSRTGRPSSSSQPNGSTTSLPTARVIAGTHNA